MNIKGKKIIRDFFYSFNANFISLLLGIIATLLFPKFLSVAGYGYYQLYIFYTGFLIITAFGVSDGVQLKIAGKDYNDLNFKDQTSVYWFTTVIQVMLYTFILFAVLIFTDDKNEKIIYVLVCTVGFITHARYYLTVILQNTNRLKRYSHIVITERSISIFISVIVLIMGYRNFILIILIDVIGRYLSFALAIGYCPEIILRKPEISRKTFKLVIRYTLSGSMILFAMQTSNIIIGISRYGIEHRWGIEEFGKVSLAIALSNMALRCINSISVVMFPTLRNIDNEKLPKIYKSVNIILMSVIFISMCFFKPVCQIISLWLPQYADSLKFSILFLPVCVYECKYSLLINTNLKNLNKEKIIGMINALAVVISFIVIPIGINFMNSIEFAIIGTVIALSVRSIIGEVIVGNIFSIRVTKNIIVELILSIIFILCNYYIGTMETMFVYSLAVIIFLVVVRKDLIYVGKLVIKNKKLMGINKGGLA